jgi:hypothetical protein
MEKNQYPITFIDYIMVVPMPGIIMLDEEISAEQLFVRDGDIFKVVIDEGRIRFVGVSRAPQ